MSIARPKSFPRARETSRWSATPTRQRGHSDQVMVSKGHAYIGHSKTRGTSVVDVRDPRNPKVVNLLPHHAHSWALHLQTHDDLLLVAEALDFRGVMPDEEYYLKTDRRHRQHALRQARQGLLRRHAGLRHVRPG